MNLIISDEPIVNSLSSNQINCTFKNYDIRDVISVNKYIEDNSERLRKKYINFIDEIGEKKTWPCREESVWWDENGVNYTGGLPLVRTSPDHGTAFNIAGKGIANEKSLIESIKLNIKIINNRKFL